MSVGDTSGALDILEGVGWQATLTTVVVEVTSTVDELLLRQMKGTSIFDETCRFKAASGGKGPAATAATLVLNWRHTSFISPVPAVWNISADLTF